MSIASQDTHLSEIHASLLCMGNESAQLGECQYIRLRVRDEHFRYEHKFAELG